MKNKKLNIIGIITVIFTVIFLANTIHNKKAKNMLGKFNTDALENATENVKDTIQIARDKTVILCKIENKTYMNFIRPLMDIDTKINTIINPIFYLNGVNNSDDTQKIIESILPVLSSYSSDMARDKNVYKGMMFIKEHEYKNLDFAQKKVIDDSIKGFKIAGVDLPLDKQKRLKEISEKLSKLSNDYSNNILAANKKHKIKIQDEKILGYMPESDKAAAKTDDGFEFSLLAPSFIPFMEYVVDRKLREEMYNNFATRATDNEKIIPEILNMRNENAKILGFENYAEIAFQFRDAKSPAHAEKYLNDIAAITKPVAEKEFAQLKEFSSIDIQPWDIAFYSRLLKKEKYNLDEAETKPYFEMDATIDGTMNVIAKMFDIQFISRDANKWDKNVRYFDVMENDKIIAGLYLDLQTRESKKPGAWANDFSSHYMDAKNKEQLAQACVTANFSIGTDKNPSLLSLNDINTLFHEMGHAIHQILSTVNESNVSGFEVDWDVVEFPSQFLESFWLNKTVLKTIGRHYKTGKEIPDDLIERIIAADHFQKALFIIRQIELGLFDLQLHKLNNVNADMVQKTLDSVRNKVAVIKVPDYNKSQCAFSHIFSGGYAAGYYSYLWAESLSADAYLAFDGNPFNKDLAHKYRETVLAMGGSKDMSEIYQEFLGRDPKPDSLLKYYGLK